MDESNFSTIVSSLDTPTSIITFLREGDIDVTDEAFAIAKRLEEDGIRIFFGTAKMRLVTPRMFGITSAISFSDFCATALATGLAYLHVQMALRAIITVPVYDLGVRCAMEPVPDEFGYDFVFVYSGVNERLQLGAGISGFYDQIVLIDPDQPVLFLDPSPNIPT